MLLPLLLALALATGQARTTLTGTVQDDAGLPVAGATVTLRDAGSERVTQTDPRGIFTFPNTPVGRHDVLVDAGGFAPQQRAIDVAAGATPDLAFTLWLIISETTLVTASRTGAEPAESLPFAVTALGGDELKRLHARTVGDIAGRLPNVTYSQHTGLGQITIRGIGSNAVFAGSDPSVAVFLDGVYLARPLMLTSDLLDVERVEVLRGPQGTLYGRNAVGGAINLVTSLPTRERRLAARLSAGSRNALVAEATAGGAIASRVMGGVTFVRSRQGGYVHDLTTGQDFGNVDRTAARGKLRLLFNDRTDLVVSMDGSHQDPRPLTYAKVLAVKPGFRVDNPADFYDVRTSSPTRSRNVQYGGSALLTAHLAPALTVTSTTAVRRLTLDSRIDSDISELNLAATRLQDFHQQISEEVIVTAVHSRVTWLSGLLLFRETDHQPAEIQLLATRVVNRLDPDVTAGAVAAFAQATVKLTSRVSAIAGIRHSREMKEIESSGGNYFIDRPTVSVPGSVYSYRDTLSYSASTPRLGLQVQLPRRALLYASATRGFKTGGFNASSPEAGRGYRPEIAWSYETGAKVPLGPITLGLSAFYTSFDDLQVQTTIRPGVLDISNAAAATITGAEFEAALRTSVVRLGAHAAWLDAPYDRYVAFENGITRNVAGNRLNNAPGWMAGLWADQSWALGRRTLAARAEWRWQDTVYFSPLNDSIQRQPGYGILDAVADLTLGEGISVGAYGRNLTGTRYLTGAFSSPPPAIGGRPGEPRAIGAQLTLRR